MVLFNEVNPCNLASIWFTNYYNIIYKKKKEITMLLYIAIYYK